MNQTQKPSIETVWDKLARVFSNKSALRLRKAWFQTGVAERTAAKRLRLLEGGREGKTYFKITQELSLRDLRYLYARAVVNVELAQNAARVNIVLNVSTVIGFVVLLNQMFPGLFQDYYRYAVAETNPIDQALSLLLPLLIAVVSLSVLIYSQAGVAAARDLKHLLQLSLARRDYDVAEDENNVLSSSVDDLRENFISDI